MTVIPDSIEPVEQWRSWRFDGRHLVSLTNETEWNAGEALVARCHADGEKQWRIVRGGMSRKQAAEQTRAANAFAVSMSHWTYSAVSRRIEVPAVEPPSGYGYSLEDVTHEAAHSHCVCGIYAVSSPSQCPPGDVFGKVKLWGTIVPGSRGSRAQYAYPSELHVPARLADDPALLAYGAPIVVREEQEIPVLPIFQSARPARSSKSLRIAVAVNFAACALNLAVLTARELF